MTAVSNRLGGANFVNSGTLAPTARTLNMQGGNLTINGNNGTLVTENLGNANIVGGGIITLNAAGTSGVNAIVQGLNFQGLQTSLLIRGDHQLNELKVTKVPGLERFRWATEAEIIAATGCKPGYLGPTGIANELPLIVDRTAAVMAAVSSSWLICTPRTRKERSGMPTSSFLTLAPHAISPNPSRKKFSPMVSS